MKAGHTSVAHLRDLRGVLERERAEIGVMISMQKHPRLQLLTVAELLDGKRIDYPAALHTSVTYSMHGDTRLSRNQRCRL